MIQWKNQPIDKLSNQELRHALSQTIIQRANQSEFSSLNDIYSTFVFGILAGAALTFAATYAIFL